MGKERVLDSQQDVKRELKMVEKAPMALKEELTAYGLMLQWIVLSAGTIMTNKYILDRHLGNFPFPIALTCTHMAFCTLTATALVKTGVTPVTAIQRDVWLRTVVPIGLLFAVTLWLGNAAYMYLSVSFVQMLKASMPLTVYIVGCMFGTEKLSMRTAANMVVIVTGVLVAAHGEVHFVMFGVALQVLSIISEALRLTLVQLLLQRKGITMNPVSTMFYVSPVCFVALLLPLAALEVPRLAVSGVQSIPLLTLLGSAALAFALNVAIFMLIGKTSALNMNVAGVVKDWLLIFLSAFVYRAPVTRQQLVGYGIAFGGVCYYNYQRYQASKAAQVGEKSTGGSGDDGRVASGQKPQSLKATSDTTDERAHLLKKGDTV